MFSFLDSNLEVLRTRNPALADRIAGLNPQLPPYLELVPAKNQFASLRYCPPDGGDPRALCSLYDPLREAQRWAENDPVSSAIHLLFLGVGLGYHVRAYLERFGSHARSITLVEYDPHLFRLALTAMDLRRLLASDTCYCFVAEKPEDFPDLLRPLRTGFMVHNFKILHHRPSQQLNPGYYMEVARQIVEAVTYDGVNTKTVLDHRHRNQTNVLKNLWAFWRGRMPSEYRDAAKGLPGFVVAAGPSLDRNVEELKRVGNRGLIIAVDTSQNTLARHGIEPHLVCTADPTELNFSHFEKVSDLKNAILAFHPECYFGIARKYPAHRFFFPLVDEQGNFLKYLRDALGDVLGEVGSVKRGMNVGQIAFNVAVHLGCDPIVLAGMDFAFPLRGGTTHARDAAVSRTTSAVREDGFTVVGGKEGRASAEAGNLVFVPGYYGDPVPTTVSFKQYIKDLEQNIRDCGREVIDATEGGSRKEGAINRPLRDVVDALDPASDITRFWEHFHAPLPPRDPASLVGELRKGQEVLLNSRRICGKALAHIAKWPELYRGVPPGAQLVQSEWDRLEDLWQEMLRDPLFNVFLDTSVTYLYYRRQQADRPADPSPKAFLECMYAKYQYILTEMYSGLTCFIDLLDEVAREMSSDSC